MQNDILDLVQQRNPNEPEFIQAAKEVIDSWPVIEKHKEFQTLKYWNAFWNERMIFG